MFVPNSIGMNSVFLLRHDFTAAQGTGFVELSKAVWAINFVV